MANPNEVRLIRRRLPLAAKIVVAMGLGIVTGLVLGERAEPLSKLGSLIIDMIKGLAGPLLLFAVIDAFLRTDIRARSGGIMVAIALTNAAIALAIGLGLSNWIQPGTTTVLKDPTETDCRLVALRPSGARPGESSRPGPSGSSTSSSRSSRPRSSDPSLTTL